MTQLFDHSSLEGVGLLKTSKAYLLLESWHTGDSRNVFVIYGRLFWNFGLIKFDVFPLCLRCCDTRRTRANPILNAS